MFLVMGITGKVGGATARHLLAQGKKVRALVRDRAKAASWTDQGVELVDGDWNDAAAIERALKGVDGAFVMLPAVWAPSPDFKEAKGVIAKYVEAAEPNCAIPRRPRAIIVLRDWILPNSNSERCCKGRVGSNQIWQRHFPRLAKRARRRLPKLLIEQTSAPGT